MAAIKQGLKTIARVIDKTLDAGQPIGTMAEKVVNTSAKAALYGAGHVGSGAMKAAKVVGKAGLTVENTGWSRKVLPKTANWGLTAGITTAASTAIVLDEGFKNRNASKLGRISYADGPARMTSSQTTGALQAARNSGSREMFDSIMAQSMRTSNGLDAIDDYGATGDLVFALHNAR